jgi:hypothetical protein
MGEVVSIALPYIGMDFKREAQLLAVNEACAGSEAAITCNLDAMCDECRALSNGIQQALIRAFTVGQASVLPREDEG